MKIFLIFKCDPSPSYGEGFCGCEVHSQIFLSRSEAEKVASDLKKNEPSFYGYDVLERELTVSVTNAGSRSVES